MFPFFIFGESFLLKNCVDKYGGDYSFEIDQNQASLSSNTEEDPVLAIFNPWPVVSNDNTQLVIQKNLAEIYEMRTNDQRKLDILKHVYAEFKYYKSSKRALFRVFFDDNKISKNNKYLKEFARDMNYKNPNGNNFEFTFYDCESLEKIRSNYRSATMDVSDCYGYVENYEWNIGYTGTYTGYCNSSGLREKGTFVYNPDEGLNETVFEGV